MRHPFASVLICTESESQCIACSGVVPEPLLIPDPSRSRFRVYFIPLPLIEDSHHAGVLFMSSEMAFPGLHWFTEPGHCVGYNLQGCNCTRH